MIAPFLDGGRSPGGSGGFKLGSGLPFIGMMPSFAAILDQKVAELREPQQRATEGAWRQIDMAWHEADVAAQRAAQRAELPACFDVLSIDQLCDASAVKRAFRLAALQVHPDCGGDHDAFIALQRAYEQALEHVDQVA